MDVPDSLIDALIATEKCYQHVKEVEASEGIVNESQSGTEPNFNLVKVVYEWGRGKDFVEICDYTDILEGAIVRSIQRAEMCLRNIRRALGIIGNTTLCERVDTAGLLIKRDIAFALSLYIEESS